MSGAQLSYPDAYAKVFASPRDSRSFKGGSYADQLQRRSPSPAANREYYSSTPTKPTSVLNRPIKAESKKNVENMDLQFSKDKDAFTRRANIYRKQAGEKFHHHRPADSILTLWESGHIVDRGRGGSHRPSHYNPVNPDSKMYDSVTAAAANTGNKARSVSAPHTRQSVQPGVTRCSAVRQQMGLYDPILHTYSQPSDPVYAAQKEKEFNRSNGLGASGIAICVDPLRASFDPITGRNRPTTAAGPAAAAAAAAAPPPRPSSAPRSSGRAPAATGGLPAERAATPGRRSHVAQGASWGTYNPVTHDWKAPPQDARFRDQNQALDQKIGISGTHTRKVEQPRNQGVYNPILNTWVVPPANARVVQGLAFAPASMFRQAAAGRS